MALIRQPPLPSAGIFPALMRGACMQGGPGRHEPIHVWGGAEDLRAAGEASGQEACSVPLVLDSIKPVEGSSARGAPNP